MGSGVRAQSVCAVIVTYNPQPTFADNIVNVAAQVDCVVVVDNGSRSGTEQALKELEGRIGCNVIRNVENLGIAVALNLGLEQALKARCDWVCTFDQDSRVSDGFVAEMLETYEHAFEPQTVAMIVPTYVDLESGVEMKLKRSGKGEVLAAMTSGSMIPLAAIHELGFFDESLFMDAVDIEFCLRARRNAMLILQSPAVLLHSLGKTSYYRFFGLRIGVTNHTSARRYYMTRNRLRLLLRYASDWPWIWREGTTMLLDILKIGLAEQDKWRKFRAIAAGVFDACRGKMGKQVEL